MTVFRGTLWRHYRSGKTRPYKMQDKAIGAMKQTSGYNSLHRAGLGSIGMGHVARLGRGGIGSKFALEANDHAFPLLSDKNYGHQDQSADTKWVQLMNYMPKRSKGTPPWWRGADSYSPLYAEQGRYEYQRYLQIARFPSDYKRDFFGFLTELRKVGVASFTYDTPQQVIQILLRMIVDNFLPQHVHYHVAMEKLIDWQEWSMVREVWKIMERQQTFPDDLCLCQYMIASIYAQEPSWAMEAWNRYGTEKKFLQWGEVDPKPVSRVPFTLNRDELIHLPKWKKHFEHDPNLDVTDRNRFNKTRQLYLSMALSMLSGEQFHLFLTFFKELRINLLTTPTPIPEPPSRIHQKVRGGWDPFLEQKSPHALSPWGVEPLGTPDEHRHGRAPTQTDRANAVNLMSGTELGSVGSLEGRRFLNIDTHQGIDHADASVLGGAGGNDVLGWLTSDLNMKEMGLMSNDQFLCYSVGKVINVLTWKVMQRVQRREKRRRQRVLLLAKAPGGVMSGASAIGTPRFTAGGATGGVMSEACSSPLFSLGKRVKKNAKKGSKKPPAVAASSLLVDQISGKSVLLVDGQLKPAEAAATTNKNSKSGKITSGPGGLKKKSTAGKKSLAATKKQKMTLKRIGIYHSRRTAWKFIEKMFQKTVDALGPKYLDIDTKHLYATLMEAKSRLLGPKHCSGKAMYDYMRTLQGTKQMVASRLASTTTTDGGAATTKESASADMYRILLEHCAREGHYFTTGGFTAIGVDGMEDVLVDQAAPQLEAQMSLLCSLTPTTGAATTTAATTAGAVAAAGAPFNPQVQMKFIHDLLNEMNSHRAFVWSTDLHLAVMENLLVCGTMTVSDYFVQNVLRQHRWEDIRFGHILYSEFRKSTTLELWSEKTKRLIVWFCRYKITIPESLKRRIENDYDKIKVETRSLKELVEFSFRDMGEKKWHQDPRAQLPNPVMDTVSHALPFPDRDTGYPNAYGDLGQWRSPESGVKGPRFYAPAMDGEDNHRGYTAEWKDNTAPTGDVKLASPWDQKYKLMNRGKHPSYDAVYAGPFPQIFPSKVNWKKPTRWDFHNIESQSKYIMNGPY